MGVRFWSAGWKRAGLRLTMASLILAGITAVSVAALPASRAGAVTPAATWTQLSPATSPPTRDGATMAYDPATGDMVLFGGFLFNDTWTWNGTTWTQQSPATSPSARYGASMAYDPATGDMVLFGGDDASNALGDTWTWDGTTWTELSPATAPPARFDATMAYDPATGDMVLFGGIDSSGASVSDTWTWDGTTWTQLSPAASPPARYGATMAYDPAAGDMVLFGGAGNSGFLGDTWTWDGTTWTQLSPATSPPARFDATMAYDPGTGGMVLFGGGGNSALLGDTWTWNGTTWTQLSPLTSPPAREGGSMAYDPGTGNMVLFGGVNSSLLNDTWTYGFPAGTPTTWTQQTPATSPPASYGASMAYDPGTGDMILFGGETGSGGIGPGLLGDTWTWDGTTWTQLSPAASPPARYEATMAYDPATGDMVLFGGDNGSGAVGDTWTWNGTTWTEQSPATSPPARYLASMAYDPGTGDMVLFGGFNGSSGNLGDTWTWDGTTWTEQSPATSPPARFESTMDYDPATGDMVLFGGDDDSGVLGDTWTWNGTTWTEQSPATSPPSRYLASMAYDPATGDMLLFGGATDSGDFNDTWTWDGATWTQLSPATSPPARFNANMAYDPATGDMVLFGGYSGGYLGDTWTYGPPTPALQRPTVAMSFGASSIPVGGTTSLSITITNPNSTDSLTGVNFSDTLPSGLVVASPSGANYPCSYTSLSATPGAGTVGIGGGTVAAGGSCTFTVNVTATSAGVKTDSLMVDSDQGTSNTATASVTVKRATTTTTISSSVNPSIHHQPVTFTATVTPTDGSGTVAFYAGTKVIPHCGTQPLSLVGSTYEATCVDASLTVGTHKITAVYSGDPNYLGGTSSVLTQKVKAFGAPAFISPVSGTPQSSPVGVAFAQPLTAVVTDRWGNPVPGTQVTFRAPSTGPSGTFVPGFTSATAVTDSTGRVTAPAFTANLKVGGPYDVTARIGAVSGTFVLTNLPAVQDTAVSIVPSQFTLAGGGTTPGFQVNAINTGTIPTSGTLTVTDTISAGLSFTGQTLSGADQHGWNCTFAGQVATCTYSDPIPVGSLNSVALYVAVTAPPGTVLTDTAVLTPTDPTPQDNTATVQVVAGKAF